MKATLEKINELQSMGIIERFAIGGGIAHFYYIEAGTTYDLDVMVGMKVQTSGLISLGPLYEWAEKSGYEVSEEHIVIEGIPVHFLPAYNPMVTEAIDKADQVEIFGVKTFIMSPEYLMVIMLDTYRTKDRERLIKFLSQSRYSTEIFESLAEKFNVLHKYKEFRAKYHDQ
jgi:DNA-binding Lrp family transcriptional regulator